MRQAGLRRAMVSSSDDDGTQKLFALAPDLVIFDMALPDRDTLEGVRALSSAAPRPIVMFSDKDDPATEIRVPLPAGAQLIVDTQRLYHAVWHPGSAMRYCLITSWESGPELDAYVDRHHGRAIDSTVLPDDVIAAGEAYAAAKRDARAAARAARGEDPRFGDGTLRVLEEQLGMAGSGEALSEA